MGCAERSRRRRALGDRGRDRRVEQAAALLLAATGFAILRYGALPRWLAWISFLFALWLLIPPIGWAGLLVGVPLWTIIVTLLLWMRPGGEPVAARPPGPGS